jgi:hypothetical protein
MGGDTHTYLHGPIRVFQITILSLFYYYLNWELNDQNTKKMNGMNSSRVHRPEVWLVGFHKPQKN